MTTPTKTMAATTFGGPHVERASGSFAAGWSMTRHHRRGVCEKEQTPALQSEILHSVGAMMPKMSDQRRRELTAILHDRRQQIQNDVQNRIRDSRAERGHEVVDDVENSGAGIQEAIELSLIQMKAQTLSAVEHALVKVEAGTYGYCVECGDEMTEQRLRALPFAVRCTACEQKREQRAANHRKTNDRGGASLFADASY
jgi:DnaK suppressor protein